jgi:NAD(P)-dependent dehydrogenase (short-subunit alcohol dehydrogenase family)
MLERCDVGDDAAMAALTARTLDRHGRIDVLVTAVGGFAMGGLTDTDRATWDRQLALNLTTTYVACRAVLPAMLRAGSGRIVAVASRAVVPPAGGFIAYTVAKAGVIAFVQALAQETRGRGVTVNAVLPSTMDTPANRAAMPDVDPVTWTPVTAVADGIAYLSGERVGHVTGTLLAV